jgi:hypothetical protein
MTKNEALTETIPSSQLFTRNSQRIQMMTCTITFSTVREIIEKTKNPSLEGVALDRWLTEGGPTENDMALEAHKPLMIEQKFRDYAWSQAGSVRKDVQSTALKQYRPSSNDISRHNPHV